MVPVNMFLCPWFFQKIGNWIQGLDWVLVPPLPLPYYYINSSILAKLPLSLGRILPSKILPRITQCLVVSLSLQTLAGVGSCLHYCFIKVAKWSYFNSDISFSFNYWNSCINNFPLSTICRQSQFKLAFGLPFHYSFFASGSNCVCVCVSSSSLSP